MPINSVYDFSPQALVEVKSWLEPWFLTRCPCASGTPTFAPFYAEVATLASARGLLGYWRLGEGGHGPYADTSGFAGTGSPYPMIRTASGTAMTDLAAGALPTADDDGAVQFNNSSGGTSDWLATAGSWGAGGSNPYQGDVGTVCGWVKPFASASSFKGGIVSLYGTGVSTDSGWSLGVEWPTRRVFHLRGNGSYLYGPVLEADKWVFVVGVKDATSTRIYLNGALVATGTAVSGTSGFNFSPLIGRWSGSTLGVLYAAVDEVSVWSGVISDTEIALLAASGGLADDPTVRSIVSTTVAYTALPGETVFANGTFTVTLPTVVGNLGAEVTVKNTGAGTITVDGAGAETIDGSATASLAALTAVTVVSDGTAWFAVGVYP